ncbi:baculoviral IAP repeat-containing protein 5-like [Arctopsyche grandis]|uniref:baculoviral IAP repeat-containing protein 5-like n=1 Tax=Arctopsyche grandis TaxID=121162 RepID=UPI00406DA070
MTNEAVPNEMVFEECRYETYKNWPFDKSDSCNAEKMAEAGFYFVGSPDDPDLVECFLCNKRLNGWEKFDDPWKEHKSHAEYCMFAQIGKAQDDMLISDLCAVLNQFRLNKLEKQFLFSMDNFKNEFKMLKLVSGKGK